MYTRPTKTTNIHDLGTYLLIKILNLLPTLQHLNFATQGILPSNAFIV